MDGLVVLAVSACLLGLTVLLVVRSLGRRDLSTAPRDLLREDGVADLDAAEWSPDTEWPRQTDAGTAPDSRTCR
ncbi:hypothetical protein ACIBSV_47905 [Embleya sp. NPDC050154]|uniref:hypothetical protein n=1 Tax=unclassified Embleya TaxID=2699296 RepID=UPI0037B5CB56|nr:hypothetical protein OG948_30005 [Embleya sp. NBC_00888]